MTKAAAIAGWRIELDLPEAALGPVTAAFDEHAEAVSMVLLPGTKLWRVEAFASRAPDPAGLAVALELAQAASGTALGLPRITAVAAIDWVAATYRAFPPVRIGRFFIHGSHWRGAAPAGSAAIRIDAATAFGSGEHATTRGCLVALDRVRRRRGCSRILDMGSGSGILALAAAKIWCRPVLAVDIDPAAVAVANANARANGAGAFVRALRSQGFAHRTVARSGPYDLILANILARPLMRMATTLEANLTRRGMAVLSGILATQAPQVLAAYRCQGLRLIRRIEIDGWTTLVVGRVARRG